jgi:hypothetical protein
MVFVLRLIHIISGVFWVGSAMFATYLLAPSLRAIGPGAGPVMNQLARVRKMPMVMMTSAIATMGAGIWLMLIAAAGSPGVWMQSGPGRTYGIGGGLAILAFLIGMAVNGPASRRLGALAAAIAGRGGAPTAEESAEMQRLQARMGVASQVVTLVLVLTTGAMAVARYVP